MNPARSSSRCEGTSASAGSSRRVGANSADSLMEGPGYRPPGALRQMCWDEAHRLLEVVESGRVLVDGGDRRRICRATPDAVVVAPALGTVGDVVHALPRREQDAVRVRR